MLKHHHDTFYRFGNPNCTPCYLSDGSATTFTAGCFVLRVVYTVQWQASFNSPNPLHVAPPKDKPIILQQILQWEQSVLQIIWVFKYVMNRFNIET